MTSRFCLLQDGSLERLSSAEFVCLSQAVEAFVRDTEELCGRRSVSLRGALQSQANRFVHRFHEERKTKLRLSAAQICTAAVRSPVFSLLTRVCGNIKWVKILVHLCTNITQERRWKQAWCFICLFQCLWTTELLTDSDSPQQTQTCCHMMEIVHFMWNNVHRINRFDPFVSSQLKCLTCLSPVVTSCWWLRPQCFDLLLNTNTNTDASWPSF